MELLPPVGAAKESPADGSLSRPQRGMARQPGAAMGERESDRARDGGMGAKMNDGELQQRQSSQLNFEQRPPGHQGQSNDILDSNQNLS